MRGSVVDRNIDLTERAREVLHACIQQVPFASLEELSGQEIFPEAAPDLVFVLKTGETEKVLVVDVQGNGQPKPVRAAVDRLLRILKNAPEAYGIIVAPYLSSLSIALCEEAGLGTVDFAGNILISAEPVYFRVAGRSNPFYQDRSLRSLYSPKASRILRTLLSDSLERAWKVEEVRDEAKVSIGLVSNVRKLLDEREWIVDREIGFSLKDPEALLREWVQNYSYRKNRVREYYTLKSLPEIEAAISEIGNRFTRAALTGFSAAARMAPAVRYQRAAAYLQSDAEHVAEMLDLKEVNSGANVMLLEPYDEGVFYGGGEIDGAVCVSPVQAYLDLKGYRGRGEEAADMLYEQVLRKRWL